MTRPSQNDATERSGRKRRVALLPAASHVDAATDPSKKLHALGELYLRGSRYSNLCTAAIVAALAFWAGPILQVWLGPALPMRDTLIPLFVLFSLAMQMHMLTGAGTSILRGMGRVYEEFSYSIPNLLFLAITLPAARWIQGRRTPFGIGAAVCVATVCSACVLMGRMRWVLDLRLNRFLRVVIVPGVTPYLVAGALAWPVALLVAQVNRWQGAGVLLAAGLLYAAGGFVVLHRWVWTDEEKHKGLELVRLGLGVFRGREASA